MSRFEISLATLADDAQLRSLLAATPMEGAISIAFAREPSYFAAAAVDGATVQVGVVRDRVAGRVVGMGSRAISPRFVNGERVAVGYLSGLRLLKEFRGQAGTLARGYRFLRELHKDRLVPYYLTTIAEDNGSAVKLLSSGRAGLPIYHPWGKYHTLSIATACGLGNGAAFSNHTVVRQARLDDRAEIIAFLHEHGPARQFFPAYGTDDLFSDMGILQGLPPEDVLLALREGEIVGTVACWNQRRFKQTVIHGYHGWLRLMRPMYNAWAAIQRRPRLPVAGSVVHARFAAIPVVRNDDLRVFQQLLESAILRSAEQGDALLLVGLHEADPFLPLVRAFAGREYVTNLYLVHWPDEVPDLDCLMRRVPYLELGCL